MHWAVGELVPGASRVFGAEVADVRAVGADIPVALTLTLSRKRQRAGSAL